MTYKLKEVAAQYGAPVSTTWKHINKLEQQKKFIRTSVGRAFNEVDFSALAQLLGFTPKQPKTKHTS